MRDLLAILVVLVLVAVALGMATTLHWYRRGHQRRRLELTAKGHTIIADIPVADGLAFFSEDADAFHWARRRLPKNEITAAQLLISGAPLSSVRARRCPAPPVKATAPGSPTVERERWDVLIELSEEEILVECGSIRQQVSQEMARRVYESVRRAIEASDRNSHHSLS